MSGSPQKHNDICIEKYVLKLSETLKYIQVIKTICYSFLFDDILRVIKCKCLLKMYFMYFKLEVFFFLLLH